MAVAFGFSHPSFFQAQSQRDGPTRLVPQGHDPKFTEAVVDLLETRFKGASVVERQYKKGFTVTQS